MISRSFLWQKLINYIINGKFLKIIQKMYQGIKSCVSVNNESAYSQLFSYNSGVRQGEHFPPVFFSLFLNDLENHLIKFLTVRE